MNDYLTFEEALSIISPDKAGDRIYSLTRIGSLIKAGKLTEVYPDVYYKNKNGTEVRLMQHRCRFVSRESVEAFINKPKTRYTAPIIAIYGDGTRRKFEQVCHVERHFDIYYSKIKKAILTKKPVLVRCCPERLRIIHEETGDLTITKENVSFKYER